MVLLSERANGTPPLSHHDQWRRGCVCKADADCASAPALDEPCSPIGPAGTGAIPWARDEQSLFFFFLQAAAAVWTFSRVFLHNGACPAAVHIIACDYLPSWLILLGSWDLPGVFELKQENIPTLLCKRFFFYAICATVLQNHAAATIFFGPQILTSRIMQCPFWALRVFLFVEKPDTVIYSWKNKQFN